MKQEVEAQRGLCALAKPELKARSPVSFVLVYCHSLHRPRIPPLFPWDCFSVSLGCAVLSLDSHSKLPGAAQGGFACHTLSGNDPWGNDSAQKETVGGG